MSLSNGFAAHHRHAIMRLQQRYRQLSLWNKVALWGSVCSILGFLYLFFPNGHGPVPERAMPPVASEGLASSVEPAPLSEVASLESYYSHLDRLQARFAERAEFQRAVVGQRIVWQGKALSAFDLDQARSTGLIIASTNRNGHLDMALAEFPPSFRLRLFALKRGDVVRVSGVIHSVNEDAPRLSATNLWVQTP